MSHHEPTCSVDLQPINGIVTFWPLNQDNDFQVEERKNFRRKIICLKKKKKRRE